MPIRPPRLGAVKVATLAELPAEEARAVVINVGTDLTAALALASIRFRTSLPALLVSCDPTPESAARFDRLMRKWEFDVIEQPVRSHGETLDWLFTGTRADKVLLVDSDAELRDPAWVDRILRYVDHPLVFGAGFVHHAVVKPHTLNPEHAYTPCLLLRDGRCARGAAGRRHVPVPHRPQRLPLQPPRRQSAGQSPPARVRAPQRSGRAAARAAPGASGRQHPPLAAMGPGRPPGAAVPASSSTTPGPRSTPGASTTSGSSSPGSPPR